MRKHVEPLDALDIDMDGFDDRHVCIHQMVAVVDPDDEAQMHVVAGHMCGCDLGENHRQLSFPPTNVARHRADVVG